MYVKCSHSPNPDIRHNNGYWEDANRKAPARIVPVSDYKAASVICRNYIEQNGLGGGNWTGGDILDNPINGNVIANVSYNGRVWGLDGKEINI